MLTDTSKMTVSKLWMSMLTTGSGAPTTTYWRILRRIVAMVYALRGGGGSLFEGERLLGWMRERLVCERAPPKIYPKSK